MSTYVIVDLGFGDAGKGTMVDAIARRCSTPPLVVRYNGGAQAGHNVHTSDGRHHTFSQFGSATLVPGSCTLLSEHMVIHPPALEAENEGLASIGVKNALQRLMIDARALVITPYQQAMNRLREVARGASRHGTCGLGVGETVGDALDDAANAVRAADLQDPATLRRKLARIRERKRSQLAPLVPALMEAPIGTRNTRLYDIAIIMDNLVAIERVAETYEEIGRSLRVIDEADVARQIRASKHVIFEGAQGVLLDEWYGFHPHTTWSTTTTKNADALIEQSGRAGEVRRVGVVRAYATRHGQGPFPSYSEPLTAKLREVANVDDGWQGRFRSGWFDVPLARYALAASPGVDALAVTCLDRLAAIPEWSFCVEHRVDFGRHRLGPLVAKPGDLEYQESLTRDLERCTPKLERAPNDAQEYVQALVGHLGLPVAVTSFGPTAEDKRWA